MPWGVAAAVGGSVAGAATSSLLGGSSGGGGASAAADPFSSQREGYQSILQTLTGQNGKDPSAYLATTPGYQYTMQQGLAAVRGQAAANGMTNSGNVLSALQTQGAGIASQQYWNEVNEMTQLSGANIGSPGTAGQIQAQQGDVNQASASAVGSSIGNAVTSGINSYGNPFAPSYSGGSDPFASSSGYGVGGNTYGFSGVSDPSYGVSYDFDV